MPSYRPPTYYRSGKVTFWYTDAEEDPEDRTACLGIVKGNKTRRHPDVRCTRTPYTRDPLQFLLSRLWDRYPDIGLARRPDGRFDYEPVSPSDPPS